MMPVPFTALVFMLFTFSAFAQSENGLLRKGNNLYKDKKFSEAEVNYKKALEKNPKNDIGKFNLGDALYEQQRYEDAASHFENYAAASKEKTGKAKAYHNLGNSLLQGKKYRESIEAYKNALKLSPKDNDTKYNLAYALAMLKEQQQNQQNKEQEQKQKEQQAKNQQQEQKEQQQKQQQKLTKEQAEQILQALKNEEDKVQNKLDKKLGKATKVKVEKDW